MTSTTLSPESFITVLTHVLQTAGATQPSDDPHQHEQLIKTTYALIEKIIRDNNREDLVEASCALTFRKEIESILMRHKQEEADMAQQLAEQRKGYEAQVQHLSNQLSRKQSDVTQLTSELVEKRSQLADAESLNITLAEIVKKQTNAYEQTREALLAETEKCTQAMMALTKSEAREESLQQSLAKSLEIQRKENVQQTTRLMQLEGHSQELVSQITPMQNKIETLMEELSKEKARSRSESETVKQYQTRCASLEAELRKVNKLCGETMGELEELRSLHTSVVEQLATSQETSHRFEAERNSIRQSYDTLLVSAQASQNELDKSTRLYQQTIAELKCSLQSVSDAFSKDASLQATTREKIAVLEESLKTEQATTQILRGELASLQAFARQAWQHLNTQSLELFELNETCHRAQVILSENVVTLDRAQMWNTVCIQMLQNLTASVLHMKACEQRACEAEEAKQLAENDNTQIQQRMSAMQAEFNTWQADRKKLLSQCSMLSQDLQDALRREEKLKEDVLLGAPATTRGSLPPPPPPPPSVVSCTECPHLQQRIQE
eukprot:PhF_6_TR13208/c0_g1_i4/m.20873